LIFTLFDFRVAPRLRFLRATEKLAIVALLPANARDHPPGTGHPCPVYAADWASFEFTGEALVSDDRERGEGPAHHDLLARNSQTVAGVKFCALCAAPTRKRESQKTISFVVSTLIHYIPIHHETNVSGRL
jgi:hypothetical protein